MYRNIKKMADEGRKLVRANNHFDLNSAEIAEIYEMYKDNYRFIDAAFDVICTTFFLGTANGYRMRKAEERRKVS